MERILEPELMDNPGDALAYDAMDHAEVNRLFVVDLLDAIGAAGLLERRSTAEETTSVEALDLGTGTAQIPIELCQRCNGLRIVAVDAAASMLEVAIRNLDMAGVRDRVMLARVDAKALPYTAGRFPIVISNSIVHHIPQPIGVLREAVRVVAPNGLLFFRDLLRPDDDDGVQLLVHAHTAGASDGQRRMFADSLRAALTLNEIRSLVRQLGFAKESVQRSSDRHWTWSAVRTA